MFGYKYGDISIRKTLYPFQISMNYTEVVHVLQPICDASQLNDRISEAPVRSSGNLQGRSGLCAGPS